MTKKDYFDWEAVKVKSSFSKKYVSLAEAIEKDCQRSGDVVWPVADCSDV